MGKISRRMFLKGGLSVAVSCCLGCDQARAGRAEAGRPLEARFYEKGEGDTVRCRLCFRSCTIAAGRRGFCRNRENRQGTLYTLVYGRAAALQLDPIEKEPMYHNLPGSTILCTGTASCNFRCKFCHNWHLSQQTVEELAPATQQLSPEDVVDTALGRQAGLSFTYNEPTVFYEYMYDIAKLGRERGMNTIFHTNGGMQAEPLKKLLPHLRAVTVDLKGFTAGYYRDMSFARMTPVLETLKRIKGEGKWLEIVNLVVPTFNDDLEKIREMCGWLRANLGSEVPLHFSRFFPAYRMRHLQPTPVATLEKAHRIAREAGMDFVYIGNVPGHTHNSTFCPGCGKRIISRVHFFVRSINMQDGRCQYCDQQIPGLWQI